MGRCTHESYTGVVQQERGKYTGGIIKNVESPTKDARVNCQTNIHFTSNIMKVMGVGNFNFNLNWQKFHSPKLQLQLNPQGEH